MPTTSPETAAGPRSTGLVDGRNTPEAAVAWLRSPLAVRERADQMLALAAEDGLGHFKVHEERLGPTADFVLDTMRERYPSLEIPFHSRWRHFDAGGIDRWQRFARALAPDLTAAGRARIRIDLAVTSVLLDAGAGPEWRYRDRETGTGLSRSEGLAVASFEMFRTGLFSSDPARPARADAEGLQRVTGDGLAAALQVDADNPLVGLETRAALLRRLGSVLESQPALFARNGTSRIGHLFDYLSGCADDGRLPASVILETLLTGFADIWPERPTLGGAVLGDVWRHPAIHSEDLTDGWVPFHKLSQWLTYSLVEPLEESGIEITDLDALTGLPEYRNGGLLIDLGVLGLRDAAALDRSHEVDSTLVVEWRALTVALLDRLGDRIRNTLNTTPEQMPLIRILEGGTWHAGRRAARDRRGELAPPPLRVLSDGTVF